MSLDEALTALYARAPLGMRLGLERMRAACARTGHPEDATPRVLIAGTNGKGSVSAMVEAAARAAGKHTGLYTSPHLTRFAERIRIDGEPIEDGLLAETLDEVLVSEPDLSFFEVATLAAFLVFARQDVDLAVLEVGIGARLDATNVVRAPVATAITRVALDHQDKLGTTLAQIATEKAFVARSGVPLALGPISGEAMHAVLEVNRTRGGVIIEAMHDVDASAILSSRTPRLLGAHQIENARVAAVVARSAGIDAAHVREGIDKVRWPGRLERLDVPPPSPYAGAWLLDGAHNPDGAVALAQYLLSSKERAAVLLFGVLADKQWTQMLDVLAPLAFSRVYAAPEGRAPVPPADLSNRHGGAVATSVPEALAMARRAAREGLVVVAGSLFLVGKARSTLLGLPSDSSVAL